MGKQRTRNKRAKKIQELNQVIIQQNELIKSSMDSLQFPMGSQNSPSGFWGNPSNEFGYNDQTINTSWLPPYEFTYSELTNLYKNPLVRRVIKLHMDDGTRAGFELTSDNDAEKAVDIKKEMDERFNWLALGRKMIGIHKNYGGGVLFADIDDGREPHEPLNENNVRKIWSFRPIERFYAQPKSTEDLLGTERPGQPMHYKITIIGFRNSQSFDVHESRLIRYPTYDSDDVLGQGERPRRITWDVSTVQIIYDAVKRYGIGMQTGSGLLQGFLVDIFKVSNLKDIKDLEGFRGYLNTQWSLRTSNNANVMGADDSLERLGTPTQGLSEITQDQRRDIGMSTEIPVPILFSEESGTLGGSTLAESEKVWFSKVSSNQVNRDQHMYRSMLKLVALEQNWDIDDIGFKFNSLEYLSEIERAELEKLDAETASIYVNELDLPSKDALDAKLTGPTIKVGALNYDPEAFERDLEDREKMESLNEELDLEMKENQVKNSEIEAKQANLESANKSSQDDEFTFKLDWE